VTGLSQGLFRTRPTIQKLVRTKETMMLKLSKNCFDKAKTYILTQGRPLEQALYRYHFDGGLKEQILVELGGFQNSNGGFGNALEPDLRAPESSALRTTFALDILCS